MLLQPRERLCAAPVSGAPAGCLPGGKHGGGDRGRQQEEEEGAGSEGGHPSQWEPFLVCLAPFTWVPGEHSEGGAVTGAPGGTTSVAFTIRKPQQANDRSSPGLLLHR